MKKNEGQQTLDVGEMEMAFRLDIPREARVVRLEVRLYDHAKTIGDGNFSLGIRRLIYRSMNLEAKRPQPRKRKAASTKTIRQSLKRKRKRVS